MRYSRTSTARWHQRSASNQISSAPTSTEPSDSSRPAFSFWAARSSISCRCASNIRASAGSEGRPTEPHFPARPRRGCTTRAHDPACVRRRKTSWLPDPTMVGSPHMPSFWFDRHCEPPYSSTPQGSDCPLVICTTQMAAIHPVELARHLRWRTALIPKPAPTGMGAGARSRWHVQISTFILR